MRDPHAMTIAGRRVVVTISTHAPNAMTGATERTMTIAGETQWR
jgi:hypothetical protein